MSLIARLLRKYSSARHGLLAAAALCLAAGAAGAATTEDLSRINEQLGRVAAPWCGKLAEFDAQGVRRCTIKSGVVGAGGGPAAASFLDGAWISEELLAALNRDELAAVMGHEMAHLVLGHGLFRFNQAQAGKVGRHTDGLSTFFEASSVMPRDDTPKDQKVQELDADALGLIFAGLAGYDVRQGADLWRTGARRIAGFEKVSAKTHPSFTTRASRARAVADAFCEAVRDGRMPLPTTERLQPPYPLNQDELARQLDPDALTRACAEAAPPRPSLSRPSPSKVTPRPLAPTTP